jgi:hypothetical protein
MAAKKCISAYMEAEAIEMKLAVAMKNTGTYTKANLEAWKNYAKGLQKITVYGDDAILSAVANMKAMGMNTEEIKKAIQASMDLASAKKTEGMDLKQASDLVSRAYMGQVRQLKEYGIELDTSIPKSKQFASILTSINDQYGGSAQAELRTYAGQVKQLKEYWGDISEKIGFALIKSIELALAALGWLGSGFYKLFELITSGWSKIIGLFGKLADKLKMRNTSEQFKVLSGTLKGVSDNYKKAGLKAMEFAEKMKKMFETNDIVNTAMKESIAKEGQRSNALKKTKVDVIELTKEEKEHIKTIKQLHEEYDWEKENPWSDTAITQIKAADIAIDESIKKLEERKKNEEERMAKELEEYENMLRKKTMASNDFIGGMKYAYKDLQENMTTFASVGYNTFKGMTDNMANSFSNVVMDAISGDLKSIEEYLKDFAQNMLQIWVQMITRMIAEWAMVQIATNLLGFSLPGAGVSGGISAISGIAGAGGAAAIGPTISGALSAGGAAAIGPTISGALSAGGGAATIAGGHIAANTAAGVTPIGF